MEEVSWKPEAKDIFDKIINDLPQFHRSIAQRLVKESAEDIVLGKGGNIVEERDLIEAFFKEVPPAFKGMMKRLFNKLNIDYLEK